MDPLAGKYPWNSPYAFSENTVVSAIELEGLEKLTIIGGKNKDGNDTKWEIIYDSTRVGKGFDIEVNLSDYGYDIDIGNVNINLNVPFPDAIGLDLNVSGSIKVAGLEGGINLIWHLQEGTWKPEVFSYEGSHQGNSTTDNPSASATLSIIYACAYDNNLDRLDMDDPWIKDGRNWTGTFNTVGITMGEELVGTLSYFTSAPLIGYPDGNIWRGFSLGIGVGVSSDGGAGKATNLFKDLLKKVNLKNLKNIFILESMSGMLHDQTYYLIYGNGNEGEQTGWNWFYKKEDNDK